jgi:hypothetical protein
MGGKISVLVDPKKRKQKPNARLSRSKTLPDELVKFDEVIAKRKTVGAQRGSA